MFARKTPDTPTIGSTPNALADQAAASADDAIKSTQRVANDALDGLAGSVQDLRQQAAPLLNRVGERAEELAHRGADVLRDSSQQLRDKALHASDSTVNYIRDEPVKAVMIAAAAGAALMALMSLISRANGRN
jgi:ElaB/YqjD/DUF883 family membrane-anchored ribosome-binding protein